MIKRSTTGRFAKGSSPMNGFDSRNLVGELHPMWRGGLPKCCVCGKKLSRRDAKRCNLHAMRTVEKRKIMSKSMERRKGSLHPQWKGGIEKRKPNEKKHLCSKYMAWALAVKRRDRWRCKLKDENCEGRLESHHIFSWREYPELRYQINNGITLCHAHHPIKRSEEKRLIPTFQELVSVSKEKLESK